MQAPQQSDGDSNDGESSSDEDCGCGCSCSHHQKPTQQELFEECDSPVKALRVSDFVEVLSYRLLRNGFKLEEVSELEAQGSAV